MNELIGNVCLNDDFFVEEEELDLELLEKLDGIITEHPQEEWNEVIAREKDARLIWNLSHVRHNLVEWLPIQKDETVLEVGAGYGALTGLFAKRAGNVRALEPSRKKCEIIAKREKNCENLQVFAGNVTEILEQDQEKYNWIFLLEDFETCCDLTGAVNPQLEMLQILKEKLKTDGRIVVACNNRLGLRFFAGCAEEHSKEYFAGVEGYQDDKMPRSFSRADLERLSKMAGFMNPDFHYPYPDYRLPMTIYSDQYLPKVGELWDNLKNFEGERYALFDESKAFDGIIKDGLFPVFSNSYLMILENPEMQEEYQNGVEEDDPRIGRRTIFSKYSNERSRALAIRTDIMEEEKMVDVKERLNVGGEHFVVVKEEKQKVYSVQKAACYEEGRSHVEDLLKWYQRLGEVFQDSRIELNLCMKKEDAVEVEYLTGKTLEEELDQLLLDGKTEEAVEKLLDYLKEVKTIYSKGLFTMTPEFEEVFGYCSLPDNLLCAPVTDIDMVVSNAILVKEKEQSAKKEGTRWIHMDYEWTFDFPIPANYVLFRVIQNYLYGNVERTALYKEQLYRRAGLTEQEIRVYRKMEESFQKYVTGKHVPLRLLYDKVSPGIVDFKMEKQGVALKQQMSEKPGIEVFVEKFELSLKYVYITGWAVSRSRRQVTFRVLDGEGQELNVIDTSYHYRKDVAEHFHLSGMNYKPIFVVKCEIRDRNRKNGTYQLIAMDGQTEVTFPIPTDKLRLKQSVIGEKLMELRGVKDNIKYLGTKEMGLIGESRKYRVDEQRYDTWRMANMQSAKELEQEKRVHFSYRPRYTVIIPMDFQIRSTTMEEQNTSVDIYAKRSVESVKRQTYNQYEILLEDDLEQAVREAKGDYIWILWPGDTLAANALYEMTVLLNQNKSAAIVYSDEDKQDWEENQYFDPQFKPDFGGFSLLGGNYIGRSVIIDTQTAAKAGGFRNEYREAGMYDLLLRCWKYMNESDLQEGQKAENQIFHIPKILYHQNSFMSENRSEQKLESESWKKGQYALEDYYNSIGEQVQVEWADYPQRYHTRWKIMGEPLVSIIIPNQDHIEDLELCVSSIVEKSTYRNFEILIVENNSKKSGTFLYYKKLQERYSCVRMLNWVDEFNYSAINNFAVQEAKGKYLIFLNNDTEILSRSWIEEMLGICQHEKVGIVGARLYYPDHTIQHVGVILGLGNVAGHLFVKESGDIQGYMGKVCTMQNLSAVTAACMMVDRAAFERVKGFDEKLKVALNDVDFCMKVTEAGWQVVYCPDAELIHYESKSRGLEDTPEKLERYNGEVAYFMDWWGERLEKGDPYYSPNLSRTKWNCAFRIPEGK